MDCDKGRASILFGDIQQKVVAIRNFSFQGTLKPNLYVFLRLSFITE
jgi:hypothetical protein